MNSVLTHPISPHLLSYGGWMHVRVQDVANFNRSHKSTIHPPPRWHVLGRSEGLPLDFAH